MPVAPPRPRRKQRRSPGLFPILLILVAGLAVIKCCLLYTSVQPPKAFQPAAQEGKEPRDELPH